MDIARDIRSTLPVDQQLSWLGKLLRAVDADGSGIKANIAFGSATQILHLGVRALEAEDYKLGLKCVYEAQNPLEIGRQLAGGSSDLLQQHAELQEDLWRHECICQSVLARQRGENLLAASLADSESLDMDSIWLVVDAYKDAAILSREMDIENEATAFSRLGMLYHDVLKVEAKATACLKQSYMLAGSLYPVPYHASWYQDVVKTMAKMQQASAKRADEELQKLRAPILEELKDELAEISKACDSGPERLLDHIYKAHPPQDLSNKQPVWSPDGAKDALKTAIAHYSSDLAQNRHDVNTGTVLQEEIRKALTAKYFIFSPAC